MVNSNKIYTYLAASLAIILPVPGRIVYGIYILIHFNLLVLFSTLMTHAIRRLHFENYRMGILAAEIIALTVLFKQLLMIFCPVAALTLSFAIYFPAVSSVILTFLISGEFDHLKQDLSQKMINSGLISAFSIVVFILRDILGFGTITLPSWKTIFTIELPVIFEKVQLLSFIATIPGCLVMIAIVVLIHVKIGEKNK